MNDEFIYQYYKEWWKGKTNPHHRHNSEEWFDAYYKEFKFHINDTCKSIIDVGCGSGEITIKFAENYSKVIGIDYSNSVLSEARKKIDAHKLDNLRLVCSDMLQIKEVLKEERVDVVFCNQAIQYLNREQLSIFIENCASVLTESGSILLMNVPNLNMKSLFIANVFHNPDEYTNVYRIVWRNISNTIHQFKDRILNKKVAVDSIGYWHVQGDFKKAANKNNLRIEFYNSIYPPYGYRFHAKLSKK